MPTNHEFDEFYGNLYHLSAEQEPEMPYWPNDDPEFLKVYKVRGVIHSYAGCKIEDTGPLNLKRMETIDNETTDRAIGFIGEQVKAGKPFFVDEHHEDAIFTHNRPEYHGKGGMPGNDYADGMWSSF